MEALKKRINLNKKSDENKRIYDMIMYRYEHNNNIFDQLKGILYIEEKTKRYKDLVLRLIRDYLDLEKIKSYYSAKSIADSTKKVNLNILRKYVELFNYEKKIKTTLN